MFEQSLEDAAAEEYWEDYIQGKLDLVFHVLQVSRACRVCAGFNPWWAHLLLFRPDRSILALASVVLGHLLLLRWSEIGSAELVGNSVLLNAVQEGADIPANGGTGLQPDPLPGVPGSCAS